MDTFLEFLAANLVLAVAAALLAVAIVLVELKRLFRPWRQVGPFELTALVNAGAVLVDLRGDAAHREGHIAGARSAAATDVEAALKDVAPESAVVLYCEAGRDSDKAAEKLALAGWRKVAVLSGGIQSWRVENLPLARN